MPVRHREPGGFDDMGSHVQAGAEAQNRTRILGNVGLEKCDLHSLTGPVANFGRQGLWLPSVAMNVRLNRRSTRIWCALHARQPIAGLRSYGKGANKTVLDCLFSLIGLGQGQLPRYRDGVAGTG